MSKKVIHIYGASGSGTTTLGRYISDRLGYLFMDVDDYFWEPTDPPYTVKRSFSKRLELMKKDIAASDHIVISGSLVDWGDELIPLFTTVIRLVTDTETRIARLRKREKEQLGDRIEPGGDMYLNHKEFIEWAASYDDGGLDIRSKAKHDEWQKLLKCKQFVLNGSNSLEYNFDQIKDSIIG